MDAPIYTCWAHLLADREGAGMDRDGKEGKWKGWRSEKDGAVRRMVESSITENQRDT